MRVKLLNGVFWALADPRGRLYIGQAESHVGAFSKIDVQPLQITLTEAEPISEEFEYASLPRWAKNQLVSSEKQGYVEFLGLKTEQTEPVKISTVSNNVQVASVDYGVLAQSISSIKEKVANESIEHLTDLLVREKQGLNTTGKPRLGLVHFLEETIANK